jgi:hypothetical protein
MFFGEFKAGGEQLYRQVHHLARNYGWSEAEIMAMSRGKRHRYLEMLAEELESANYAS